MRFERVNTVPPKGQRGPRRVSTVRRRSCIPKILTRRRSSIPKQIIRYRRGRGRGEGGGVGLLEVSEVSVCAVVEFNTEKEAEILKDGDGSDYNKGNNK